MAAERAELAADFTKAAFRLRPGLKFHDGHPLSTQDVKWTYEHYKGVNFKIFQDKLDRIEIVDDRTIIFHFKEPFVEFIDLYNGGSTGIVWILPQHYYEKVGREGFIARPLGAGPFKFFIDVIVPLSKTMMAAIFIIMFVYGWNQYLWPTLMTTDERFFTLVRGIKQILLVWVGSNIPDYNEAFALAILAMLPPVMIVLIFQRWFIKGLTESDK